MINWKFEPVQALVPYLNSIQNWIDNDSTGGFILLVDDPTINLLLRDVLKTLGVNFKITSLTDGIQNVAYYTISRHD